MYRLYETTNTDISAVWTGYYFCL